MWGEKQRKPYSVDPADKLTHLFRLSRRTLLQRDPCVWLKAFWQLYPVHISVVLGRGPLGETLAVLLQIFSGRQQDIS